MDPEVVKRMLKDFRKGTVTFSPVMAKKLAEFDAKIEREKFKRNVNA
jgi:hypothetical protein